MSSLQHDSSSSPTDRTPYQSEILSQILSDPFYKETYRHYGSIEEVYKAGFLYNPDLSRLAALRLSSRFLCTPLSRISITPKDDKKHKVVLLSDGSFDFLHSGHISMMEQAKSCLENQGDFEVIGGYFSPLPDSYTLKPSGHKLNHSFDRINFAEELLIKHPWLMVDSWASKYTGPLVNFTTQIERLQEYLRYNLNNQDLDVFFVCGSDHADFTKAFVGKGGCVCVSRSGYSGNFERVRNQNLNLYNKNILYVEPNDLTNSISSSSLRSALPQTEVKSTNKPTTSNALYIIRDEGILSLQQLCHKYSRQSVAALKETFLSSIKSEFSRVFNDSNLSIVTLSLEEQLKGFAYLKGQANTLSNDAFIKGRYNISVSRLFEVSTQATKSIELINRPGSESLGEQLAKIPEGSYVFIDDDSATGFTFQEIKKILAKRNISIAGSKFLNHEVSKLLQDIEKNPIIYDINDVRDFLIGSDEGGLVVRLHNKKITRVPYMLPYVSVANRAKVPFKEELSFSKNIWQLNRSFYQALDPDILLRKLPKHCIDLFSAVGFTEDTKVLTILDWHIKELDKTEGRLHQSTEALNQSVR